MKNERLRAGFWRRVTSLFLDAMLIFIPFQILAAILFALTAGSVQFDAGGISVRTCYKVTSMPSDLKPAPPANANAAQLCKNSFFGAETARRLIVARVTKEGNTTYTASQTYMVGVDNKPVNGWSLDWLAYLALLAYLIVLKLRKGGTFGDRAVKISLVDDSLKTSSPPNIKQMAMRYGVLLGPFLVAAAIIIALNKQFDGSAELMAANHILALSLAVMSPALIYYLICAVQIIRKLDPMWDRAAMTAVIKRSPK